MYPAVVCAWCQGVLKTRPDSSGPISHGICIGCIKSTEAMAFEDLGEFSQAELDELPVGVIELDQLGFVRAYNKTEASYSGLEVQRVIGRHFFREIAPCTQVAEFQGNFDRLVQSTSAQRAHLNFVFAFATGECLATISMNWDPGRQRVTVIVDI